MKCWGVVTGDPVIPSMDTAQGGFEGVQSQVLWGLLLMSDCQAGEPDVGVRTLILVGDPLQYNYFPVCQLPPQWV